MTRVGGARSTSRPLAPGSCGDRYGTAVRLRRTPRARPWSDPRAELAGSRACSRHSPVSAGAARCRARPPASWSSGCCCGGCCRWARSLRAGRSRSARVRRPACTRSTASSSRSALAKDMPRLDVQLLNSDGSQENVRRVATGQADFTIAAADAVETYKLQDGPGADQLRGCARLYDDYVHLVVPRTSSVQSVGGPAGQEGRRGADRLRGPADRGPCARGGRARPGRRTSSRWPTASSTMPELLKQGKIDAFFWSGGLPTSAVLELSKSFRHQAGPDRRRPRREAARTGRRLPLLPGRRDARRRLSRRRSRASRCRRWRWRTCWSPREDADAELTEELTRTVIDSRDRIGTRGARGAAGGPADGHLHRSAAAARGRAALLPVGQAVAEPLAGPPSRLVRSSGRDLGTAHRHPQAVRLVVVVRDGAAARREQGPGDGQAEARALDVLVAGAAPEAVADAGRVPRR